jgi:GntR family transcriptional regulator
LFADKAELSPIYRSVADALIERIGSGDLLPGSRCPSERRLASEYGISRMTARAAVNLLVQRGYVARKNGSGTFVASPKIELDLSTVAGFSDRVLRHGIVPGARVIEARTVGTGDLDAIVTTALEIPAEEEPVHVLIRVRTGNNELLALEKSYFPARHCPDLLDNELTGSIYELLRTRCNLELAHLRQKLEVTQLDASAAEALATHPDAPALRITRTTCDARGRPIEFARDLYRGDRLVFVTEAPAS